MRPAPTRVKWLGHSTVSIELDGERFLTDPLLRARVAHLRRCDSLELDGLPRADAVLISHVHWDHLDLPSLRLVGRDVPILAPRGSGRMLGRQGFAAVTEVDFGTEVEIGNVVVTATKAEHRARRRPWGAAPPSLGYVLSGRSRVYFAGDTDLFPEMSLLGPVDVALLPISGWGDTVGPGHLDARRAAEAVRRIEPRVVVPIHWGTFEPRSLVPGSRSGRRDDRVTLVEFVHLANELAPETRVVTLLPGETAALAHLGKPGNRATPAERAEGNVR